MDRNLRSHSAKQTAASTEKEVNQKSVLHTVNQPGRVVKSSPLPRQPKRPNYAKWSKEQISARIDVLKTQMALFEAAKQKKVNEFLVRQGLDRTAIGVLIHEAAKYTAETAV